MTTEIDEKPWDIKRLILSLGGEADCKGFITFEVFNNDFFSISEGDSIDKDGEWAYEDVDIEAAKKLRDFLNYALKDK